MKYLLPVAILGCFCFDYSNDVHWPPWAYLTLLISALLTWRLTENKKVPLSIALLFGWILASGIAYTEWRPLTEGIPFDQKAALRVTAAHSTLEFLLLTGLFYTQWRLIRRPVAWGLFFGGLLHTLLLIFDQLAPMLFKLPPALFATKGLLGNRSIGASFTAVWLFFTWYLTSRKFNDYLSHRQIKIMRWASSLALIAIAVSVSSISYASMLLALFCTLLSAFYLTFRKTDALCWTAISACLFLFIGFCTGHAIDPEWGGHVSRQDAWPMFFNWYMDHINILTGSGAGTFKFYGPFIQEVNQYQVGRWWLWAHNDWLQILLEFGVLGFSLAIFSYFILLKKSFDKPFLFGALIAYGVVMAGNYPVHIAMFGLLGFWLTFETLWGKDAYSRGV